MSEQFVELEFNAANLEIFRQVQERLESRVDYILERQCKIIKCSYGNIENIKIEGDEVKIKLYDNSRRLQEWDDYTFPVSYLFDDNWEEDFKAELVAREDRRQATQKEQIRIAVEKQNAAQLQTYQQLKAKFEPNL